MDITPFNELNSISVTLENHIAHIQLCRPKAPNNMIAEHSPATVTGCKNMINYSRDHSLADSLNHMATWQSGMFQLADILEGIQAQSEKRQANYENLKPIVHSMD